MKERLWNQTIQVNLFFSVFIYLPILIPFSSYISAYRFLFQIILLHLLIVTAVLYNISSMEE